MRSGPRPSATARNLVVVEPFREGSGSGARWGVRAIAQGHEWVQPRPVNIVLSGRGPRGRSWGYSSLRVQRDGFCADAEVKLAAGVWLFVEDSWRSEGDELVVLRRAVVRGEGAMGFSTSLSLARDIAADWRHVTPFAPGALYGESEPVPERSIGNPQLRRHGASFVLCREDRLGAPLFAVCYRDGIWAAVLHANASASTTVADRGYVAGGESLVDERFAFASLGGVARDGRLYLGAHFPGTEGPVTYSTGAGPLRQHRRWRRRFHPMADGVAQSYDLVFRWGNAGSAASFFSGAWRWAWTKLAPSAPPAETDLVVTASTSVLAEQVVVKTARVRAGGAETALAGVPLEVNAATGEPERAAPAIMGFVGANTDAAYVLVRAGERLGGRAGARYRALGEEVLDCFSKLELVPPAGEGYDLASGRPTTYRKSRGTRAVYTRSIADGCAGALKAWSYEASRGRSHPDWLAWACSGGDWLVSQQGANGSLPRAWAAGSGAVLETSTTATHVPVAFLVRLAQATGNSAYLDSALRAAEFSWNAGGAKGCFAGATLDNPDVVDKEAAVFAMEGFLELYLATGRELWLRRAVDAASVVETWIYAWDVPMPVDARAEDLHWKPGVPTAGQQLIATGVSTCDGFLAMNAAAFATLYSLTGDDHFLEVARLVTHGTKAMLALPGRTFDLKGPGWQQEHWCLAIPRGYGLTRHWLPWVAVANVEGVLRLEDLGAPLADLVLRPACPSQ